MFKKKSIYIIGIVVFTLILIADLAIYFMVPSAGNMGGRPGFDSESFSGELPEGFDGESFNPESFGGEMPEGFDGEMPEGFTMPENGEMPEGFEGGSFNPEDFGGEMPEDGEMPEGFSRPDNGEMPEGFDASDFRGGNRGDSGALSTVRKAFIPILIICILGDGACIFMLIRLSKKKENNNKDDGELNEDTVDGEVSEDSTPKRDKTNTRLAVIAVILVLAVSVNSLASGGGGSEMQAEKSILQQEAALNDISSVFAGSGTLKSSTAIEMELPTGVTVNSYTVKNGESVKKGDVIAKVDKQSVLNAIYEVQKLIEEMDEEISDVKNDTLDSTVTARAEGRVKAVYVEKGDTVSKAMYDNGALILISLGGSMSVEIESDKSVSIGEAVSVTLSDKSKIEGKIQQVKSGKIIVTVTDNGPTVGDSVTVYTTDGTKLGKGKLEVSSPLKVTGIAGTVEKVYVEVGDEVDAGDTLLTLENTKDEARYRQLLREREELTNLVSDLSGMYKSGTVEADQSGVVSLLSDDIGYTEQTTEAETKATNVGLSYSAEGKDNTLKLSAPSSKIAKATLLSSGSDTVEPSSGTVTYPAQETTSDTQETTTSAEDTSSTQEATTSEQTTAPTQNPTVPDSPTQPNENPTQPSTNPTEPSQVSENGVYAGKVLQITYNALQVKINQTKVTDADITKLETMNEALFTVQKQLTTDLAVKVYMYKDGKAVESSLSAIQAGDRVFLHIENGKLTKIDFIADTQSNGGNQGNIPGGSFPEGEIPDGTLPNDTNSDVTIPNGTTPDSTNPNGTAPEGSFNGGAVSGGMTGSFGGSAQMPSGNSGGFSGQQAVTEEEEEATYIVEKFSLCAITPSETMEIDVNVDELDVLSLKTGQTASVTLDALPGQSITGTLKRVSPIGSTEDGGSTKYTATISVSRTEEMLDGMNASIKIEVNCLKSVLTIPAAAVYEDGNRTFVYTDTGSKEGELKDSVDIVTGASDGELIEVISGLNEGDSIYYSYADSIVYRTGR